MREESAKQGWADNGLSGMGAFMDGVCCGGFGLRRRDGTRSGGSRLKPVSIDRDVCEVL